LEAPVFLCPGRYRNQFAAICRNLKNGIIHFSNVKKTYLNYDLSYRWVFHGYFPYTLALSWSFYLGNFPYFRFWFVHLIESMTSWVIGAVYSIALTVLIVEASQRPLILVSIIILIYNFNKIKLFIQKLKQIIFFSE
jgi:hypothetical protein